MVSRQRDEQATTQAPAVCRDALPREAFPSSPPPARSADAKATREVAAVRREQLLREAFGDEGPAPPPAGPSIRRERLDHEWFAADREHATEPAEGPSTREAVATSRSAGTRRRPDAPGRIDLVAVRAPEGDGAMRPSDEHDGVVLPPSAWATRTAVVVAALALVSVVAASTLLLLAR